MLRFPPPDSLTSKTGKDRERKEGGEIYTKQNRKEARRKRAGGDGGGDSPTDGQSNLQLPSSPPHDRPRGI